MDKLLDAIFSEKKVVIIVKMNDNSDVFYTDLINGYDILFNAIEYTITKNKEAEEIKKEIFVQF